MKDATKEQAKVEEQVYGHSVTDDDVASLFQEILAKRLLDLLVLQKHKQLGEDGAEEKEAIESKLAFMKKRDGYRQSRNDIMANIGRVARSGQRKTMLTGPEEALRLKLTWQDFDYTQDMLVFCREPLNKYVTDVVYWKAHVEELVQEFEDEIPLWVGIRKGKRARDATENRLARRSRRKRRKARRAKELEKRGKGKQTKRGVPTADPTKEEEDLETLPKKRKTESPMEKEDEGLAENSNKEEEEDPKDPQEEKLDSVLEQVRETVAKGQDKKRVTFLNRCVLTDTVQGEKRRYPKGKLIRQVAVIQGEHCCLDYISKNEKGQWVWNRDWSYELDGEKNIGRVNLPKE